MAAYDVEVAGEQPAVSFERIDRQGVASRVVDRYDLASGGHAEPAGSGGAAGAGAANAARLYACA